jgi:hypothetical protein
VCHRQRTTAKTSSTKCCVVQLVSCRDKKHLCHGKSGKCRCNQRKSIFPHGCRSAMCRYTATLKDANAPGLHGEVSQTSRTPGRKARHARKMLTILHLGRIFVQNDGAATSGSSSSLAPSLDKRRRSPHGCRLVDVAQEGATGFRD